MMMSLFAIEYNNNNKKNFIHNLFSIPSENLNLLDDAHV